MLQAAKSILFAEKCINCLNFATLQKGCTHEKNAHCFIGPHSCGTVGAG